MNELIIFLNLFYLLIGVVVWYGIKQFYSRKSPSKSLIQLAELTVIIPFRNEEKNLQKLLESINKQSFFPKKIIFVNDHSDDNSLDFINNFKKLFECEVIELDGIEKGKKTAIRKGIEKVETEFVLTFDADITLPSSYFKTLEKVSSADMIILPVMMKGKTILESFYALDYALSHAINYCLTYYKKPILASGANLLFRKSTFLEVDSIKEHHNIASGDDVFLLRDFIQNKAEIRIENHENLMVETETPISLQSFLNQRLRWIGKSKYLKDNLNSSIVILSALMHFIFVCTSLYLLVEKNFYTLIIYTLIKMLIDVISFQKYLKQTNQKQLVPMLALSTFIYPIYILSLIAASFLIRPIWKDRRV